MNKKKLVTIAMALSMVAILAIGGTLAYFTSYDEASNVFTTGNVTIELTESVVAPNENGDLVPGYFIDGEIGDSIYDEEGNLLTAPADDENPAQRWDENGPDPDRQEYVYGKLYPAQQIFKDPTIENQGTEDAYIAAKVTVRSAGDLESTIPGWQEGLIDIATPVALSYDDDMAGNYMKLVSGGLADEAGDHIVFHGFDAYEGESYVVVQNQEDNGNGNEYVLYFFIKEPVAPGEKVVLFDSINMHYAWNNEEMAAFENLCIDIFAYAVQSYGFEDDDQFNGLGIECLNAMIGGHRNSFEIFLPQE